MSSSRISAKSDIGSGCLNQFRGIFKFKVRRPFWRFWIKKTKSKQENATPVVDSEPEVRQEHPKPSATEMLQSLQVAHIAPPRRLLRAKLAVTSETKVRQAGIKWELEEESPAAKHRMERPSTPTLLRPPPRLAHLDVEKERMALRDKAKRVNEAREASIEAKIRKASRSTERGYQARDRKIKHDLVRAKLSVSEVKHQTNNGIAWVLENPPPRSVTPFFRPPSRSAPLHLSASTSTIGEIKEEDLRKRIKAKEDKAERAQRRADRELLDKVHKRMLHEMKVLERKKALIEKQMTAARNQLEYKMEKAETRRHDLLLTQQLRANLQVEKARRLAMKKKQKDMLMRQRHRDKLRTHPESTPAEFIPPQQIVEDLQKDTAFWDG